MLFLPLERERKKRERNTYQGIFQAVLEKSEVSLLEM